MLPVGVILTGPLGCMLVRIVSPCEPRWSNRANLALHTTATTQWGWRPVPMLTICCGCVLSENYTALLTNLTAEATLQGFIG